MPQMAPLYWMNLFIFFVVIYALFLISNHFFKVSETSESSSSVQPQKKFNWKW